MRPLTWEEYYEKFDTWSESTRVQYVSRLSNVGDHSQVADIANRLYNQGASDKLIRVACDAGIRFTAEDVYLIELSVSPEVLQMAKDGAKSDFNSTMTLFPFLEKSKNRLKDRAR